MSNPITHYRRLLICAYAQSMFPEFKLGYETNLSGVASPKSPLGDEGVVGIIPHRPPHLPN
jgi:hypothetical protein